MTTTKQLTANHRNAQKSTGPKTPEGKAIVCLNAMKHGLLSRAAVDVDVSVSTTTEMDEP